MPPGPAAPCIILASSQLCHTWCQNQLECMWRHIYEMPPKPEIWGWIVWNEVNTRPVSLHFNLCCWGLEELPCPIWWTRGLPASDSTGGEFRRIPSGCSPPYLSAALPVPGYGFSLSCLLTYPCVSPTKKYHVMHQAPTNVLGTHDHFPALEDNNGGKSAFRFFIGAWQRKPWVTSGCLESCVQPLLSGGRID